MRLVVGILIALAVAPLAAGTGNASETERFLVAFDADPGLRAGDAYHGHPVVAFIDGLHFVVVETSSPSVLHADARADGRVRYVEVDDPLAAVTTLTPNDAMYANAGHWGSKKIGAEAAWDRTLGSTAVKVAMVDSGLLKTHEEFAGSGRVLQGFDFVNNDNDPNDQGSSCGYHGTHTTGTAGATLNNGLGIAGMSQHTILPIKVFYPVNVLQCGASTSGLVNGLKYAGDQGAHISSNSWGSSANDASINDAVLYAHNKGTAQVAAAGNSGQCTNCVSYPWRVQAAITIVVSSTTSSDAQSSFSSEGPEVDVAAPGSGILSSCGGSANSYCTYDGTSMATPHVAGTAALLKALNPTWGFADLESRLRATAVDLGATGFDHEFGYGRVNADAATAGGAPPPPAQCADGLDNDGDGFIDHPSDVGCTSSTDDDETNAPPPPPAAVHTHDIDHTKTGKNLKVHVWAFDDGEAAESGVTISATTCRSGGSCQSWSATSGSDGSVQWTWSRAGAGTYTTTVTNMVKSGFTWDSAAGHAGSGNAETETV